MEPAIRRWSRVAITIFVVCVGAASAFAKDKPKISPGKNALPPGETLNACGCYHDAKGGCVCTDKKAKCDCAGDCEPVGCGAKRDKEIEREMAAEIKRAQEDEKRRNDAQRDNEAHENGSTDAGPPPTDKPPSKTKNQSTRKDSAPDKTDDK
jgi:hypothetical protein